jgi:tRNA threonylcarbamoyladenosine biosynthesis protein TsaB
VKLLALDTATELCSAALWLDGALRSRELARTHSHSELILPMIGELLDEAGVQLTQLDAIAFGRGPGGFTGVRLAAGVAQGLAFAAQLPLLPISDLRALAAQALALADGPRHALICQDARMDEVYWGGFELRGEQLHAATAEAVAAPGAVMLPPAWDGAQVVGAGSGFDAYATQLADVAGQLTALYPQLRPRAREIALLAAQDGMGCAIAAEHAQPVYLRDNVAQPPSHN